MTREKLDALTGLRIVAAGMIAAHHSRALQIPVPNYALDHGVRSGFIIAYAIQNSMTKATYYSLIARIAVCYFCVRIRRGWLSFFFRSPRTLILR